MKKNRINSVIICLLASVLFFTSCQSPSPPVLTEADKQYLKDLFARDQEAWNQGEREQYINRYAADAIFMIPNAEQLVGKDAIRTFLSSFPDVKISFNVIEIMGSADLAYVQGAYTISNPADSLLDKGKFVDFFKKFPDDKWLVIRDIFNSDLPVPVPQNTDQKK